MNAIEIKGLKKVYGDVEAVVGLDLAIAEGELFALLGVNGAGKSTTIKMLSCLTPPTAGNAWLLGHSISEEQARVKPLLGVSPQETAIAPNLTVRENLEFMAGIHGMSKTEAKFRTTEMIETMGLQSVQARRARTLSGGWQRRLSIALALVSHPKILFLDEPTLGLDVLARRELWKVIEALKGKVTVILTTHYLEEAESLADRIAVMAGGRLQAVGTVAELLAMTGGRNLEDAFVILAEGGGNR